MINIIRKVCYTLIPFLYPPIASVCVYLICNYIGCDEWYTSFGFNLSCNACIDIKKQLKDHQIALYLSIGATVSSRVNSLIKTAMNKI